MNIILSILLVLGTASFTIFIVKKQMLKMLEEMGELFEMIVTVKTHNNLTKMNDSITIAQTKINTLNRQLNTMIKKTSMTTEIEDSVINKELTVEPTIEEPKVKKSRTGRKTKNEKEEVKKGV